VRVHIYLLFTYLQQFIAHLADCTPPAQTLWPIATYENVHKATAVRWSRS